MTRLGMISHEIKIDCLKVRGVYEKRTLNKKALTV
jgi:hypothetical protein